MRVNLMDVLSFMEAVTGEDSLEWLKENADVDRRLDKDVMVGQILKQCGGLQPVYHEIEPFRINWKLWFKVNKLPISHLCDTLDYEYSPLETYDWHEVGNKVQNSKKLSDVEKTGLRTANGSYTDTEQNAKMTMEDVDSDTKTTYGKQTKTDNTETRDLHNEHEDENKTSAYNEDLYQPEATTDGTAADTGTVKDDGTEKLSGTDRVTVDETTGTSESGARVLVHNAEGQTLESDSTSSTAELGRDTEAREKFILGNNGNFTKQQLIDQERGIAKFNIYEWIANKFQEDNCYRIF